jgi:hypothetical protein
MYSMQQTDFFVKPLIYIEKSVRIYKYEINSRVARLRAKKEKVGIK